MTNYQIINDEEALKAYIDWLPETTDSEIFYGCLFARKKYCKSMPWPGSDKNQLKRFTSKKSDLISKIRQMECVVGSYTVKGIAAPQESLALYLHVNPRDLWKATIRSIGQLAKMVEANNKNANPHQEILSEIQKTVGKKRYIIFDIDTTDLGVLKEALVDVRNICHIIQTRGGYHVLVPTEKASEIQNKKWYQHIIKFSDVSGDNMSPVPGCVQGGFVPLLIKSKELDEKLKV